jgi:lipoprotein-releasing system ATP-binding protein
MMSILKAENIYKNYGTLEVLKGISLTVSPAEVISIVGASGAGKSTLLQILGTLDTPDKGTLIFDNINLLALDSNKMAEFRNQKIGFVFQFHNLLPEFTALENVALPGLIAKKSKKDVEKRATEILEFLGLKERIQHKPSEMSGGEQQRTAVARALINSPSIVFADEPSGNLDSNNANDLHNLFFKLRDEFKQSFVIVTHNNDFADMADRKIVIKDGICV